MPSSWSIDRDDIVPLLFFFTVASSNTVDRAKLSHSIGSRYYIFIRILSWSLPVPTDRQLFRFNCLSRNYVSEHWWTVAWAKKNKRANEHHRRGTLVWKTLESDNVHSEQHYSMCVIVSFSPNTTELSQIAQSISIHRISQPTSFILGNSLG